MTDKRQLSAVDINHPGKDQTVKRYTRAELEANAASLLGEVLTNPGRFKDRTVAAALMLALPNLPAPPEDAPEETEEHTADSLIGLMKDRDAANWRDLLARALAGARRRGAEAERAAQARSAAPVQYEIIQERAGVIDAFVWIGERPDKYTAPARVIKYETDQARIAHTYKLNIEYDQQDVDHLIAMLSTCREIAQRLDREFPDGVPDQTQYLHQPST